MEKFYTKKCYTSLKLIFHAIGRSFKWVFPIEINYFYMDKDFKHYKFHNGNVSYIVLLYICLIELWCLCNSLKWMRSLFSLIIVYKLKLIIFSVIFTLIKDFRHK